MALEAIGFVFGVIPELRQQFKSLQTHLFNFNRGPVRYNDLNDRLNVASKYVETIHDILKEHPGVIPTQTSDIFQNSLTSVCNCLKHSNDMMSMLVQKEIPRRPGTRRTFAYFRPRARANSNADVMSTVETQIKEASNTLQSLADVMSTVETQIKEASNTLQSLVEQLNVFLKIYTQQHTSVAANTEAKYTYGMNTPGLLSKVSLDFATTDANDEPVTPEGNLKRSVLIGTKVTAAASVVPDAFGVVGMAGVGKTTALQGLAHDEEIRLHFVDGVLYMALGQGATERTVMDGISSIMKTTGATDTDRTVEKCALLSDAVNCAVKWFKGRVCLFLVDDMWPTEICGTGYLGELRQLLRSCQASRMAITTRSRAITLSAEQIVDFNVRAPHGDMSRNIFMKCATATLRGEVPAGNNVEFRSSVSTILSLCAGLPIALSIAGSAVALRAKTLRGDFRSACNSYAAELYDVKSSLADEMNTDGSSLSACIELSLKYLQEEFSKWKTDNASNTEHSISDLYVSLCVLTYQSCVPLSVLSRMWRLDEERVRDVVNMLCDMSLVRIDYPIHTSGLVEEEGLMVHDLLVQFCKRRAEKNNVRTVWHSRLLEGYLEQDQITCEMGAQAWGELLYAETLTTVSCRPWWSESVPKDGYINGNVARHLSCSGLVTELVSLLLDARWTQLRMQIGGILALRRDFEWVKNNDEIQGDINDSLRLILTAITVSWGRVSEGPSAFLFQVCGLLHSRRRENKIVATYLNSLEAHTASPYLLPASSFRRIVGGIGSGAVRVGDLQLDEEATEKPSNTNSVFSVALSQDGLRVASGSQDNAVRLWDSRTGDEIGPLLEGHTDCVRCVAFSPDGRHLVSGSEDKTLRVWDAETFSQIGDPMKGHAGPVSCVSFSWDGLRIVSGSTDSTIHIWDAQTRIQAGDPLEGHVGAALVASESRDGRHVVSRDEYDEVIIWNRDNQSIVWKSKTWQSDSKRAALTKSVTTLRYAVIGEEARKIISSCGQEARHLWPKSFPANVPEVSCEGVYVYSNASGKETLLGALPSPCNTWKYNGERNLFVAGLKSGAVLICFLKNGSGHSKAVQGVTTNCEGVCPESTNTRTVRDTVETPLCYFTCGEKASTMFSSGTGRVVKLCFSTLASKLSRMYRLDNNTAQYLPSDYRNNHDKCCGKWEDILIEELSFWTTLNSFGGDDEWNAETHDDRIFLQKKKSRSFFVFMCDFFMAYDDESDLLLIIVPLSKAVVVSPAELCMNDLLDEVPEEQVHFIARRLVQLTSISWDYGCLALLEQTLPGAKRLSQISNLFDGKSVDLGPSFLDVLVGCRIGMVYWNILDLPYSFNIGLEMFGVVIGLWRGASGVAYPEILPDTTLTFDISLTDHIDMSIGGSHDEAVPISDVESPKELNLSFIPKNLEFEKLRHIVHEFPAELEKTFLRLGYGEQLSAALRRTAGTHFSGKELTVEGVQSCLLTLWRNVSHYNLVPLSFNFSGKTFLRRKTPFLVNNGGLLYVARSSENIQRNVTIGLNVEFLSAAVERASSKRDIVMESLVCNLLDAAELLHGPRTGFQKCRGAGNWYKVHQQGMSDLLGALTLVSLMLKGKVVPYGEFKGCVPETSLEHPRGQEVDFNIPMPYGLAYSTFADGFEPPINASVSSGPSVFCLRGCRWNLALNYPYPAVLAGPRHSTAVQKALFCEASVHVATENQRTSRRLQVFSFARNK